MFVIGQLGNQFLFINDLKTGSGIIVDVLLGTIVEEGNVSTFLDRGCWEEVSNQDLLDQGREIATHYGVDNVKVNPPPPLTITYSDVPYPPLHVNCRCCLLPVILEEYR